MREVAAYNLAWERETHGELWKARKFYRMAAASQDPELAKRARAALDNCG